uniref:Glycosyltransferase n=1 Tax=viral metagenome TaxID=1070528 RepID=A0A6C0CML0_9ZZZZ
MSKKKIALCFFGVIPRSIRYTYRSIKEMITEELKPEFDIDILVFNLNIKDALIDNQPINQNDVNIIENIKYCEEELQENADIDIKNRYGEVNGSILRMRFDYGTNAIQNSARQMYSEYRLGEMLEKVKDQYDTSIVCGPDYFLLTKIDIQNVKNTITNKNLMYVTAVNPGDGFTNGFYMGNTEIMVKLLKRYTILDQMYPSNKDYEYSVMRALQLYKITVNITNMVFFKIRNSKKIERQGIMLRKQFNTIHDFVNSII